MVAPHKLNGLEEKTNGTNGAAKGYTIQAEAQRIFSLLVSDPKLDLPEEAKQLASTVEFDGDETQPFYPVPYKCAESQAAVLGYVGLLANTIAKIRYGTEDSVKIDV